MLRVAIIILMTIGFAAFALSNAHSVGLSFVFGETDVRLIFLLMSSYAAGAFATIMYQMVDSASRRSRRGKIRVVRARPALKQAHVE
jgi:uncharacterized integral membrane protein